MGAVDGEGTDQRYLSAEQLFITAPIALRLGERQGDDAVHCVRQVTALIEREGDGYVALCPELDVASQGDTVEEARRNLQEAVELFLEAVGESGIQERFHPEVYVSRLQVG